MASNLSMQPKDAAEINDMFSRASASERALILHNLQDTPLRASARIPAARARRAIETLEMAAFAADVENFTLGARRDPDIAVAGRHAGGQRSRRRAAGLRRQGAGHAERGVSAGVAVSQAGIRLLGAQRLPAVAALRPVERTIRADHAGRMARLDHGGHPRQISGPHFTTTNAIARARRPPQTRPAAQAAAPAPSPSARARKARPAPDRENAALPGPRSRRSRHPGRTGFPWRDALPPRLPAPAAFEVGMKKRSIGRLSS